MITIVEFQKIYRGLVSNTKCSLYFEYNVTTGKIDYYMDANYNISVYIIGDSYVELVRMAEQEIRNKYLLN